MTPLATRTAEAITQTAMTTSTNRSMAVNRPSAARWHARPWRASTAVQDVWRSWDSLERDGPRQQVRGRGAARDRPCIGVPIQVIGRARPPVPLAARRRRQCKPQQGLHLVECEDDVRGVTMFEVGVEREVPTGHTPRRRRRRKRSRPALWNAGRPPTPCPCPCEQRRSIHARIAAPTSPVMSELYFTLLAARGRLLF